MKKIAQKNDFILTLNKYTNILHGKLLNSDETHSILTEIKDLKKINLDTNKIAININALSLEKDELAVHIIAYLNIYILNAIDSLENIKKIINTAQKNKGK